MKSIRQKITLTYVGLTVLLVAAISTISSIEVTAYFRKQLVNELSRQADLVTLYLQSDSTLSDDESDRRLRSVSLLEGTRTTLIDAQGAVIADSDIPAGRLSELENHLHRPEIQQALKDGLGVDTRHSVTVGRDYLYVAKLLNEKYRRNALQRVSVIRVSMPLEDVQQKTREIHAMIITTGLIVLILVAGISIIVSRRISGPMVRIAGSIERIRSGNLDERVPVTSDDEIGQVGRAVNEMAEKLKTDIVQLRKLEGVRSEFLANVSHELRTPIFAIQGFLETLLSGAIDDPTVNRSFLERAQSNASRLNTLLTDLINISQIESGEMRMSFRYFRVREFLDMITRDFQTAAQHRQIKLTCRIEVDGNVEVFGDRERLRQVLDNLIENALRYNTPNGLVELSAKQAGEMVRIAVSDTGIGIPPEHLGRVFERFYRVDKDRSREVGGTGLGLAIVKHIVEAHGSKVEVTSLPGAGSTFSFNLKMG